MNRDRNDSMPFVCAAPRTYSPPECLTPSCANSAMPAQAAASSERTCAPGATRPRTKPCRSPSVVPGSGRAATAFLARSRAPATGVLPTGPRPARAFLLSCKKRVRALGKTHRKRHASKRNACHRKSTRLVRKHGTLVAEDLNIETMTRFAQGTVEAPGTNVKQRAGLNRSILG